MFPTTKSDLPGEKIRAPRKQTVQMVLSNRWPAAATPFPSLQAKDKECYFSRALQKFYSMGPYSYRKAVRVLGMINIEKVALDPTIFQQSWQILKYE